MSINDKVITSHQQHAIHQTGKNTFWNLLGSGAPLLAALFCIPYTLKLLGNEAFGVLTLIWALIGYFNFFDFGAGRALTYHVSQATQITNEEQQYQRIRQLLLSGFVLTTLTGLLGTILVLLLAPFLAQTWLKLSPVLQDSTRTALQITALGIIPATITSGMRGALEGIGNFKASNINKMILGFGMFLVPALCILLIPHANLVPITWGLIGMRLINILYSFWQLRAYLLPKNFASSQNAKTHFHLSKLMQYGFWVTISGIISPIMVYGDRFFVSNIMGADALASYAIPQEGLVRILLIPIAICGALMPVFATLASPHLVQAQYQYQLKRMIKIMGALCLIIVTMAYPGFYWWISPEFANTAYSITLILTLGTFINGLAVVPYTVLHATNRTRITAIFHCLECMLYLTILVVLTRTWGLHGAAWAWVLRVTLDFILLHWVVSRTRLESTLT